MNKIILYIKPILICSLMIALVDRSWSQEVSPSLISSGSLSTYEGSIGESFVSTISNNTTVVTSGFHQGMKISTSLDQTADLLEIKVFPNPFMSYLNVVNKSISNIEIMIFNVQGQIVYQQKLTELESTIDLATLSAGTYQMILSQNNKTQQNISLIKI